MKLQEIDETNDTPSPQNSHEDNNKFPEGMRVLAIDDDRACLRILERLLMKCRYKVTGTTEPAKAIKLLEENKNNFDIVITDVHMPCGGGLKIMETVGLEMDIPVVMVSSDDKQSTVMEGINHGACDYLIKPIRLVEIKNIWQHVLRRTKSDFNHSDVAKESKPGTSKGTKRARSKDKDDITCIDESTNSKRQRFNWKQEYHALFISVVKDLEIDKAVPSKILERMNIPGLTREQVASHLQKFRNGLKKSKSLTDNTVSTGIEEHLSSTTRLPFNNQRCSAVTHQGFKGNGCSSDMMIKFNHPLQNIETCGSSVVNPKLPPHCFNQQNIYPLPYHQSLPAMHHTHQRMQVPTFGGVTSNSLKMDHVQHSGLRYQGFPSRIIPTNKYTELSSSVQNYNVRSEHPPSGYPIFGCTSNIQPSGESLGFDNSFYRELIPNAVIPAEMSIPAHPQSEAIENFIPGQFESSNILNEELTTYIDENFMLSGHNLMDEQPINHMETDNLLQPSSCSSTDDDLSAVVKQ
ncbi:hypothetical protein IFM89_037807 [Coptis chinensis]|uniref:Response regulatory domain-containing protein n=1 Tax=Coptis chinensis TaxID=261450 RepID=A0A835M8H4_9MAGN|nr:hypothetical protein IFM89_037807 [Coptis chinensis]